MVGSEAPIVKLKKKKACRHSIDKAGTLIKGCS